MKNNLIHIRVGKKLREEIESLIDEGMFSNQSEIVREGIRDLIIKYKKLKNEYKK